MASNINHPITSLEQPGIRAEGSQRLDLRKDVADLLGRSQLGFPGAQPVSFAKQHLDELTKKDYFVCEKSDGIRYLLYSTEDQGREAHFLIDRKNDYWYINNSNLHLPLPDNPTGFHTQTIIDGELVWDKLDDGSKRPTFYMFDCLVMDGLRLMDRTLDKRLAYLRERLWIPYETLFKNFPDEIEFQPFILKSKEFQVGYGLKNMFEKILPNLRHENDGLVFTCRTTPYKYGTDPHILKWKQPEDNTVDFRLKLKFHDIEPTEEERREGLGSWTDYDSLPISQLLVFTGHDGPEKYEYFEDVHITEEEWERLKALQIPLDDMIVECYLDQQRRWRIVRSRIDKPEANHSSTVTSVLKSIQDGVTEQNLLQKENDIRLAWKARQQGGSK
ncbi:unnamed protein product [Clonostachys rosea f. rosea IK726]|uniref:mRNA-capping enzyme subunit alpha n=2 Tax=Bionectria ochroleuca TaxID=29856 RepID=A0A0B7JRN5_BIOOC|nr:unnamed protein product [Clonostachys rosea f. rosea IK726]